MLTSTFCFVRAIL